MWLERPCITVAPMLVSGTMRQRAARMSPGSSNWLCAAWKIRGENWVCWQIRDKYLPQTPGRRPGAPGGYLLPPPTSPCPQSPSTCKDKCLLGNTEKQDEVFSNPEKLIYRRRGIAMFHWTLKVKSNSTSNVIPVNFHFGFELVSICQLCNNIQDQNLSSFKDVAFWQLGVRWCHFWRQHNPQWVTKRSWHGWRFRRIQNGSHGSSRMELLARLEKK